jgi:hypothetical protein
MKELITFAIIFLSLTLSLPAAITQQTLILNKPKEFVIFTMPKTGTHLLIPFLERLTGKEHCNQDIYTDLFPVSDYERLQDMLSNPNVVQVHWWLCPIPKKRMADTMDFLDSQGQYMIFHAPYLPSTENLMIQRKCVVFFIIRDPRDYVVSFYHHLMREPNMLFADASFRSADRDTKLHYIIMGTDWFNSAHTVVNRFLPWKHSPVCCTLRFEKLIGPIGGACTPEEHIAELRKIKNALNINVSDVELLNIFYEIYGTGKTFHRGIVGSWKEYFNGDHKVIFKQLLGDVLIGLGYESDYNW